MSYGQLKRLVDQTVTLSVSYSVMKTIVMLLLLLLHLSGKKPFDQQKSLNEPETPMKAFINPLSGQK